MKRFLLPFFCLTVCISGMGTANAAQQLISAANGSCLANPKGSMEPATRLVVVPCNGNPNQLWEFYPDGRIVNAKSGLCLSVPAKKLKQRAGVYQADCNNKKHRLWQPEYVGDAVVKVRSGGGLCLDIQNKGKKARSKAVQATCAESASQVWQVANAPASKAAASAPSAAFDPEDPVREIISIAASNFSVPFPGVMLDYFAEGRLERIYSKDLIGFYKRAIKTEAAQQMGGRAPDFDIFTGTQDACPLENISLKTEKPFESSWDISVTYQYQACWGNPVLSKTDFIIIEEGGQPVIDDIFTYDEAEAVSSLKVALDQYVLGR
ncbi:RICIN domain-containing protein [Roseibium sp.]|uniref:RICIN domain-containing protein n=1 Tax=Roseibium sp. TaxID=1936156 RepID=UPI003B529BB0